MSRSEAGLKLKAARALADVDQQTLANEAQVNVNTIRATEASGANTLTSGLATIRRVQEALEQRGIEFLNHGSPGVRLR
jgi:DNA-binding XRE family transcriptional regulator